MSHFPSGPGHRCRPCQSTRGVFLLHNTVPVGPPHIDPVSPHLVSPSCTTPWLRVRPSTSVVELPTSDCHVSSVFFPPVAEVRPPRISMESFFDIRPQTCEHVDHQRTLTSSPSHPVLVMLYCAFCNASDSPPCHVFPCSPIMLFPDMCLVTSSLSCCCVYVYSPTNTWFDLLVSP
jgi:hypothetical protein